MLESDFQARLIKDIKQIFEGCVVFKTDPRYIQGIPDLIILWENKWAALECKKSIYSIQQANQLYWVTNLDAMSFASFIYPENKEEVLDALQAAFGISRTTRISIR